MKFRKKKFTRATKSKNERKIKKKGHQTGISEHP